LSPAGTRRNGTRKFGTAGIGRLLGTRSPQLDGYVGGQEEHQPRHATPKAASRKRAAKLAAGVAAGATLAGAAAYGIANTNTHNASAALTADMVAAPSAGQPFPGGASQASLSGHADSIVASVSHSRPAAVRHPAPTSKAPAGKAAKAAKASASKTSVSRGSSVSLAASANASAKPASFTLSCGTSGMLPANVTKIVSFLLAHGYSHNAAAGIAGNMYQESKGNPELQGMGGGGLIGFTPLPAGYVTGNVAADLKTQLNAVLAFDQQWAGYLPELNRAATAAAAADVYVTKFERAGIPAAGTREAAAQDVVSACGL
jgi:hypothetical protein